MLRRRALPAIALLLSSALLLGCAAPRSQLDARLLDTLHTAPQRVVLVAYLTPGFSETFQNSYASAWRQDLTRLGITAEVAHVTGLELDRKSHLRRAEQLGADLIVHMHFEAAHAEGSSRHGRVRLSVATQPDGRELWHCLQLIRFDDESLFTNSSTQAGLRLAHESLEQLHRDRVLQADATKTL